MAAGGAVANQLLQCSLAVMSSSVAVAVGVVAVFIADVNIVEDKIDQLKTMRQELQ